MSSNQKNVDIGREEELPAAIAEEHGSIDDVPQLGLVAAIASLSYVFWVVGGMEMIERLAYYGVKAVATLYAKDPVSKGGLGVTMTEFGTILATWALVQSILPVFTGGLSDKFGYKPTIAASTVVKICGYLTMATFPTYRGFLVGALVLARWLVWRAYRARLGARATPRALEALDAAGRPLQIAGSLLPLAALVLVASGLIGGAFAAPLLALAGLSAAGAGAWFKFTLVTRAGFNQGFALTHLPVRGVPR